MLSTIFISIIVTSPILAMYGVGTSSLTLLDLSLSLFIGVLLIRLFLTSQFDMYISIKKDLYFVYFYPSFILFIALIHIVFSFHGDEIESLFRTIRFLLYFLIPLLLYKLLPNISKFVQYLSNIALFISLFLLIQYFVLYIFSYYIQGYLEIPFFPIIRSELITFSESINDYENWIRPRAVLGEPSQIGIVVGIALFMRIYLYNQFLSLVNLILMLALIFSFSTTAFTFIISNFLYYLIQNKRFTLLFILSISIFIVIFVIFNTFDFDSLRIVGSLLNRVARDSYLENDEIFNFLFGFGYGNDVLSYWLPSIDRIILSFGYLGVLSFFISLLFLVNFKSFTSRYFLFIYLFFTFGNEVPISYFNLIYISIFIYLNENKFKICVVSNNLDKKHNKNILKSHPIKNSLNKGQI